MFSLIYSSQEPYHLCLIGEETDKTKAKVRWVPQHLATALTVPGTGLDIRNTQLRNIQPEAQGH